MKSKNTFFSSSLSPKSRPFLWQVPMIDENCNELFQRYRNGDEAAREKIILKCIPMAILIAIRFDPPPPYDIDDLIAEGVFGIIRAIEKFRPELGYSFTTYAAWWIYGFITRFLQYHQSPNSESVETIMDFLAGTEPISREEVPHGAFDELIDHEVVETLENKVDLQKILSLVDGRKRKVLENFLTGKSFRSLGKEWSISGQRISEIYRSAIQIVKKRLKGENQNTENRNRK